MPIYIPRLAGDPAVNPSHCREQLGDNQCHRRGEYTHTAADGERLIFCVVHAVHDSEGVVRHG